MTEAGRVLVLGGARSGKSSYAEALLAGRENVVYVAPWVDREDPDWAVRVAAHRAARPPTWRTVEDPDVAAVLRNGSGSYLVDCVTTWLAAAMEAAGCWRGDPSASAQLADRVEDLVSAYGAATRAVLVSNELGQGVVPATESGRAFRDEMGRLNQRLAEVSETVWLLVAGIPLRLK